ncbi:hypothetical protein HRG_000832 [Hirsutella rhossiliensis]|uniref:Uncharacterized protein n=1 Tax=Hirsutella rhossiliensis TaxID=111463 RepID=A0A9P8N753_9HYPO|nr:uncharacterized protein HRG_00832 [Hirsutella rhossiliensis]KAH0968190.1 hypothetical protein HRG_00832 [Hirsutella rhossiliensis]
MAPELVQITPDPTFDDAPWYRWWVLQQVRNQPQRLLLSLPDIEPDKDPNFVTYFLVWDHIRQLIRAPGPKSIDGMTDTLTNLGIIAINDNNEAAQSAKDLVFATLGWQTMLYKPDFASCSAGGYSILDEMDGFNGGARLNLNQFASSSNRNLPDFLLGFGMMLPPRNYCSFHGADDQALFNRAKTVISKELDAYILSKVCGLTFQWIDSLSCHLELDTRSA